MGVLSELKMHSLSNIIGMSFAFVRTKLFYKGATLIRYPFYLRGRKDSVTFSDGFMSGRGCRFEVYGGGVIAFGDGCHIGDMVHIVSSGKVSIGEGCLFASKVFISDTSHGEYGQNGDSPYVPPNERPLVHSFVAIGDNVWLGENVVVLPGVTIGDGCVIGANSTVTKDIPANSIAVGSPAVPIKRYDDSEMEWMKE